MNRTVFKVRFKVGPNRYEHETKVFRQKRTQTERDTNNTKVIRTLRTRYECDTNHSSHSEAIGGSLRRPHRLYKCQARTVTYSNAFWESTSEQHNTTQELEYINWK